MAVRATLIVCAWMAAAAAAAAVSEELRAARTAQCRAMCLDEYRVATPAPHGECLKRSSCLTCWEKCSSLNPAGERESSTPCHLLPDCEDIGCRRACQFHLSPRAAPPAQLAGRPRLELSWDGAEARWSLTGPPGGQPRSNVVFLLLAGTASGWKELVQTSEVSVVLVNLRRDTPLRLLAVTRDGLLAAADGRLQPRPPAGQTPTGPGLHQDRQQLQSDGVWLLETVAVERDSSSMALVQISWQPRLDGAGPAQYLVTWELSGGGIKGHLYTDISSVTLSLWPESVYNIQVELLSVTSQRSVPLVISTYREEAVAVQRALPPSHQAALALLAAVLLTAAVVVVALLSRSCRWHYLRPAGPASRRVFVLTPAALQKRVPSPLRSVLVQACRAPAPVHHQQLTS